MMTTSSVEINLLLSPSSSSSTYRTSRTPPAVLTAMKSAVAEVSQTRSILSTLGAPPDHKSVDLARACIVEIESGLSLQLENIVRASRPPDVDVNNWRAVQAENEKECRAKAEREKIPCQAVIQLEKMHEAYDILLKDAKEKLVRIYEGNNHIGAEKKVEEDAEEEQVNEEVIAILREASERSLDRVKLLGPAAEVLAGGFREDERASLA